MRVGKDIVPYNPVASRVRSKSLKQVTSSDENEYKEFLDTFATSKDVSSPSVNNLSSSYSSGSSIIRMLQDLPDSHDSVLPGSTSSSGSNDQSLPQESSQSSQSCLLLDAPSSSIHENVIQALPGYTTIINEDVQVSKLLCFYP